MRDVLPVQENLDVERIEPARSCIPDQELVNTPLNQAYLGE